MLFVEIVRARPGCGRYQCGVPPGLGNGGVGPVAIEKTSMEKHSWDVERRNDGAVLVRVHSADREGCRLPDAVFAFRPGDPQYNCWEQRLNERGVVQV